jgi:phospholipid/cholesterol/gamma-HCH transport system substrate-binding protein
MEISNRNQPIKIGVVSLWVLTLLLIAFIFYIIGSNQKLLHPKYSLYMFLPNIQGLDSGAFITLSGLKVGVVGELKFDQKDSLQGILIELKIEKKFLHMITTSSIATIKTMGVLGDKYVDISLGDLTDPVLQDGEFIKSKPPLDIDLVIETATIAINDFKLVLQNLNKITSQALEGTGLLGTLIGDKTAKDNLIQTLTHLKSITSRIVKGEGNAGKFVQDSLLYQTMLSASKNLNELTRKVQRGEGSLGKIIADTTFFARLNSISQQTDSLLKKLHGEGTVGKLINDKELYNRLLHLTQALTELSEDLKNNPKKYVQFKLF